MRENIEESPVEEADPLRHGAHMESHTVEEVNSARNGAHAETARTIHSEDTAEWPAYRDDGDVHDGESDGAFLNEPDDIQAGSYGYSDAQSGSYGYSDEPDDDQTGEGKAEGVSLTHAATPSGPGRRPRFRDRQRGWWMQALADDQSAGATDASLPAGDAAGSGDAAYVTPLRSAQAGPHLARKTRMIRGLIAAGAALFIIGVVVGRLTAPSASVATPPVTVAPTATAQVFAPSAGAAMTVNQVLGAQVGLAQPRAAAVLPDGRIVVADTGNSRLVILRPDGRLLRSIRPGPNALQQPYAIEERGGFLYVLDAARGAIEKYTTAGNFVTELIRNAALVDARGMAAGPDGRFYIANPLTNSIQIVAPDGKLDSPISSPLGAGPGQFNQPSDVAVGADGTIYVMDSQNGRIEALTPGGAFVAQWPAPHSDTIFSVHLLLPADGRIIASDPSGGLLLYGAAGGSPTREAISTAGQAEPLGLALLPHGRILVVDGRGNRLLVVTPS